MADLAASWQALQDVEKPEQLHGYEIGIMSPIPRLEQHTERGDGGTQCQRIRDKTKQATDRREEQVVVGHCIHVLSRRAVHLFQKVDLYPQKVGTGRSALCFGKAGRTASRQSRSAASLFGELHETKRQVECCEASERALLFPLLSRKMTASNEIDSLSVPPLLQETDNHAFRRLVETNNRSTPWCTHNLRGPKGVRSTCRAREVRFRQPFRKEQKKCAWQIEKETVTCGSYNVVAHSGAGGGGIFSVSCIPRALRVVRETHEPRVRASSVSDSAAVKTETLTGVAHSWSCTILCAGTTGTPASFITARLRSLSRLTPRAPNTVSMHACSRLSRSGESGGRTSSNWWSG